MLDAITPLITILPGGQVDRRNAALALGRKPKTLANWKSKGIGPRCFQVLGRCRYDYHEIQDCARGHDVASAALPSPRLIGEERLAQIAGVQTLQDLVATQMPGTLPSLEGRSRPRGEVKRRR